jgi:hypothetical protein
MIDLSTTEIQLNIFIEKSSSSSSSEESKKKRKGEIGFSLTGSIDNPKVDIPTEENRNPK